MQNILDDDKCGKKDYVATGVEQALVLPATRDETCKWNITTTSHREIEITRVPSTAPVSDEINSKDQCVTVYNTDGSHWELGQKICAEQGKNHFTGEAGKDITIEFEAPKDPSQMMSNFKVYYVYDTVSDERCGQVPGKPTTTDQYFMVAQTGDVIPKGLLCLWSIPTSDGKGIRVSLDVQSPKTDTQCVAVANADQTGASIICGKQQNNTFTSSPGKGALVAYADELAGGTQQSNFKIHYQLDVATKSMLPTMLLSLSALFSVYGREW
ncbi:unnamed protein product [Echinostoma caproni]|uniref:CUB domain-containing protein n=1 Tax=Echinostoma caproni TaxID=27848 RepID=A0A183ANI5_9TREM|nr:unnamed protein product [Echinostoma caproni]